MARQIASGGKGRRSKYGAVRTSCGSHEHASKREAARCGILTEFQKRGMIRNLEQQPSYDLWGVKYRADFRYEEFLGARDGWRSVVEDCKGFKTAVYRIKKKLMKNVLGIEIKET